MKNKMTLEQEVFIVEAAEAGNVDAQLQYGKMLCGLEDRLVEGGMDGCDCVHAVRYWDGTRDGITLLEKAAEAGNAEADEILRGIHSGDIRLITEAEYCYNRAMQYIHGDGIAKDLKAGEELLCNAAEAGWAPAQRELAKLFLGIIDQTYTCNFRHDPRDLLEKASRQGDAEALHRFAIFEYVAGKYPRWADYPVNNPDYTIGLEWLSRDAEAGNSMSQFEYAQILIWTSDIEEAKRKGIDYLICSSENGYALAAYHLGELRLGFDIDLGDVFQPDRTAAIAWFEKAEQLGCVAAADRLGELLYPDAVRKLASGTEIDSVKRVIALTKIAAEAGFACSQMRLAAMYADGMVAEGADENVDSEAEARYWLLMAEKCGSNLAHQCLELISKGYSTKEAIDFCREKIS